MVRHSLKYVPHKDKKEVAKDLKSIYSAINERQAKEKLEGLRKNGIINIQQFMILGKGTGLRLCLF